MKIIIKLFVPLVGAGLLASCGDSEMPAPAPELSFEESFQIQLIEAQPGDVIEVPAGTHNSVSYTHLTLPTSDLV